MDPEDFRREAHRIADWIADYLAAPERYPGARRRCSPATSAARFPHRAPEHGGTFDAHLRGLRADHPARHHALEPSRLLRLLRDHRQRARRARRVPLGRAQRAGDAVAHVAGGDRARRGRRSRGCGSCSACPTTFEGVIYDTASISTLHALAAARELAVADVRDARAWRDAPICRSSASTAPSTRTRRSTRPSSCSASATTRCAASTADAEFRMRPDALAAAIAEDRAARPPAARGRRDGRHDVDDQRRSGRRDRGDLRARAHLAARRRRVRRRRGDAARLPLDPARRRPRRLARRQPAQVAVHAVRSQRASTAAAWTSSARRSR